MKRNSAMRPLAILVALVCSPGLSADGAERPSAQSSPRRLRVAAVQMRSSRKPADNAETIRRALERCAHEGIRVAVFPECALTGYFDDAYMRKLPASDVAAAEQRVAEACRANRIYAVVGTTSRSGTRLFNSAAVFDPSGRVVERYHKIHLAESWPDPGDHLSVFKIDGVLCSIIICHDERYPELVRLPALAGACVIFYLSHESRVLAEKKIGPYRAQIQARAVENGVYIVHANAPANRDASGSHGQSRIIEPDGTIVREASMFGEETVSGTLDLAGKLGRLARRSAEQGPLADWWRDGVKRVRMVN